MGTDRIEVTQDGRVPTQVSLTNVFQDRLHHEFCTPIGAGDVSNRMFLGNRTGFRFPVHGTGRAEYDVSHLKLIHNLKQGDGTGNVVVVVGKRLLGGLADRLEGREMKNCGNPVLFIEEGTQCSGVARITSTDNGVPPGQLPHPTQGLGRRIRKIVKDDYVVTCLQ